MVREFAGRLEVLATQVPAESRRFPDSRAASHRLIETPGISRYVRFDKVR